MNFENTFPGLNINSKGNLMIGNCDTIDLAKQYGTPLYVMNEEIIKMRCREYSQYIQEYFGGNGKIIYASKAMSCLEICRIIQQEGLGIDVVSAGELNIALKAGFNPADIHFHGNNKTPDELRMAINSGVGRIIIDNFYEIELLEQLTCDLKKDIEVGLRIKPGVEAHTHEFIRTGQIDSKFGFALETGEAIRAIETIKAAKYIHLKELHCHIGSQILLIDPFLLAAEIMMDFISQIYKECGILISELNLGGGFGISYKEEDISFSCRNFMQAISNVISSKAKSLNLPVPYIYFEPGRSIAGPSGITLYTVGAIKEIPGVRTYVCIDGGMTDNPRYALYRAPYTALIANKASQEKTFTATIAGKCCESGDLIQENILIQPPKPGDIMAVLCTGAYNYAMASAYNCMPIPPVIKVNGANSQEIIKRANY